MKPLLVDMCRISQSGLKNSNNLKFMAIKKCTCVSEFQDGIYGKGNRWCNEMKGNKVRCTVCGREFPV